MKRIALVGMPNTGKSTFFNRLTGGRARVGNWPGVTVELMEASVLLGGDLIKVVDLPGVADLQGTAPDERVTLSFLEDAPIDLIVLVLNMTQLDRQWHLCEQVAALNRPMMLVLNMADEAKTLGIRCDAEALAQRLACPIRVVSASKGLGWPGLLQGLGEALRKPSPAQMPERVLDGVYHVPPTLPATLTRSVDRVALHPALGWLNLATVLSLLFGGVYMLGTLIQEWMEALLARARDPLLDVLSGWPAFARGLLVEGVYDGAGSVITFAPLVASFYVAVAVLEDSGYLARIAFLLDALFARLRLDGRAFVMWLMGMGCNVPAVLGTRIIREQSARRRVILTLPMALCSARLQVFIFIALAVYGIWAPLAVAGLYLASLGAMLLTVNVFRVPKEAVEPLVLELPPYRLPQLRYVGIRSLMEVGGFVRLAAGWIVLGVVLVWLMQNLSLHGQTLAAHFAAFTQPFLAPIGIPPEMGVTLLLGFAAKEAVVGAMSVSFGTQMPLTLVSGASFMVFALLYVPCLSTLVVVHREAKSWRWTGLTLAWSFALAWGAAFVVYQGLLLIV